MFRFAPRRVSVAFAPRGAGVALPLRRVSRAFLVLGVLFAVPAFSAVAAAGAAPAPKSAHASASTTLTPPPASVVSSARPAPHAFPSLLNGFNALDTLAPLAAVRRHLAAPGGFARGDFDLLLNFRAPLPPAPSRVTALLREPALADSLVPALRAALRGEVLGETAPPAGAATGFLRTSGLWPWLDVAETSARRRETPSASVSVSDLSGLTERVRRAEAALHHFIAPLSAAERGRLARELPSLFRPNAEDTLLNPLEREAERLRGEALTDSLLRLARRLPLEALARASGDLDAVQSRLLSAWADKGADGVIPILKGLRARGVPVILGTRGHDVHRLTEGLVFDPGGDDRYEFPDSVRPGSWLMVIDAAGGDVYVAGDSARGAGAFLSAHLIADLAGDDVYEGGDFAFGAALLGVARLYDAAGNDRYRGRAGSLGFAFHGVGIVHDRAGNDEYSSSYLSQGASSAFGFGILIDEAGDDVYESRPEFLDDLRYRDRFLSLSQGFSTGFAPRYGGGLAVLWDRAGNDRYTADIFGQGAGYWFGWGLLMDDAGHDTLKAWQYAQGAGVHFAAGMLLDGGGDDARVSKGVSQGCGHDGGFGLFVDAGGDDVNRAVDMSAGAGSANGLGVMIDFDGDDVHDMADPAMTLGHGDMRRDRASMGFFLDLGGRDTYPGSPSPDAVKAGRQGEGDGTAPGRARTPRENGTWRAYDGVKRGHGFGKDGGER